MFFFKVISISRYSSFGKLLRITSLVLKFIKRLKKQPSVSLFISAEDLQEAQTLWIWHLQRAAFRQELQHLKYKKAVVSSIRNLNLFLDADGVIRCRGRISSVTLPDCNNPILIPSDHNFETLIIRNAHEKVFHGGVAATLAKIREQFWILKGRQKVKKCLRHCVICKKIQGLPFAIPPPAELPDFRCMCEASFSNAKTTYAETSSSSKLCSRG